MKKIIIMGILFSMIFVSTEAKNPIEKIKCINIIGYNPNYRGVLKFDNSAFNKNPFQKMVTKSIKWTEDNFMPIINKYAGNKIGQTKKVSFPEGVSNIRSLSITKMDADTYLVSALLYYNKFIFLKNKTTLYWIIQDNSEQAEMKSLWVYEDLVRNKKFLPINRLKKKLSKKELQLLIDMELVSKD